MKLSEIYEIADGIAPKALSDEYCERFGAYDNSGILVDTGDDVKRILFSLDFSFSALKKAKEVGANLIITHHPAIYGKIGDIRQSDFDPLDTKLITAIKNGISVISMHLNLDAAEGGIDESLMEGVCVSAGAGTRSTAEIMHSLKKGGYGRAYDIKEIPLCKLAEGMGEVFQTDKITVYGDKDKKMKRVASFCGAGADEGAVRFAEAQGADVMISSDFKHHVIALAIEKGLSVISLTHYASENYGFEKYYQKISRSVGLPCVYHADEIML